MKTGYHKLLKFLFIFFICNCAQKSVETTAPVKAPEIPSRLKPSFGIKFSTKVVHFQPPLENGSDSGLRLDVVFPYFPAAKAGLQSGDLLIGFQNEVFHHLPADFPKKFTDRLTQLKLGQTIRFEILRDQPSGAREKKTFLIPVQTRNWSYGDRPIAKFKMSGPPNPEMQDFVLANLNGELHQGDLNDLQNRFSELAQFTDGKRLPAVSHLQKNPFELATYRNELLQVSRNCKDENKIWACLETLNNRTGRAPAKSSTRGLPIEVRTPQIFLREIADLNQRSNQIMKSAFQSLTSEELKDLREQSPEIAHRLSQHIYLHEETDPARLERNLKFLAVIEKIKTEKLFESLLVYRSALDPRTFKLLKQMAQQSPTKEIVSQLKTREGLYLIGGIGNNDYSRFANQNIIFILDLGGNDKYSEISANIIDLSGDDEYRSDKSWSLNSGILAARFLADLSGNDLYQCPSGCLASSFFGASLLLDFSGNDSYLAQIFSAGSSFGGFSTLMDFAGQDLYEGSIFSQGVGVAGGIGALFDISGDDIFRSKSTVPSSYGDAGEFEGWSQGVGIGLRNFISGGLGLIYDGAGSDQFESGTFSQGGGYYFGVGSLINDGDQNDHYLGARYCQGFSAHYAIGLFLEVGGNDQYRSPSFVGQGLAWDLSLTLFEDQSGNDHYKTCHHCLGVSSQNSFAFFLDRSGQDSYAGTEFPYNHKGINDYHGGRSLGVFFDSGGSQDYYERFKNNFTQIAEGWQILKDQ